MSISLEERAFIRHALGLSNTAARGKGYRNRYFADDESEAVEIGRGLVKKGMAVHYPPSPGFPDHLFLISSRGFEAVRLGREHMDAEEALRMKLIDQRAFIGADINAEPAPAE